MAHLVHNRVCRFGSCGANNTIDMWPKFELGVEIGTWSIMYDIIKDPRMSINQVQLLGPKNNLVLILNSGCGNILRDIG